jgi:ribosomal protein L37E
MTVEVTMEAREDGTVEVLSPFHWWCRECGRWEVCDEHDRCRECGWMRRHRPRTPRRSGGVPTARGEGGAVAPGASDEVAPGQRAS